MQRIDKPVLIVPTTEHRTLPEIRRILVALDGSINSERVLPYARAFARAYGSKVILLTVPAVPEVEHYRAAAEVVETIRSKAEVNMRKFLEAVARSLREDNLDVVTQVTGSMPARTIAAVAEEQEVDMIMITTRGRGRLDTLMMGSVAERIVHSTNTLVFLVPIVENLD